MLASGPCKEANVLVSAYAFPLIQKSIYVTARDPHNL